ncbi:hypothetical protein LXA43DRAFT_1103301 [Ganoderma leucocontextum]|nr:hypothetical protein LXA43DRAFT_1103301 [Ganoderma leucocontextum]
MPYPSSATTKHAAPLLPSKTIRVLSPHSSVAQPNPDAYLHTITITACVSRVNVPPQPACALDLFTEMTVDKGIASTVKIPTGPSDAEATNAIATERASEGEPSAEQVRTGLPIAFHDHLPNCVSKRRPDAAGI